MGQPGHLQPHQVAFGNGALVARPPLRPTALKTGGDERDLHVSAHGFIGRRAKDDLGFVVGRRSNDFSRLGDLGQ